MKEELKNKALSDEELEQATGGSEDPARQNKGPKCPGCQSYETVQVDVYIYRCEHCREKFRLDGNAE